MSNTTPPPSLPDPPPEYNKRAFDELNRTLRLFFSRITTLGPLRGTTLVLKDMVLASRLVNTIPDHATTFEVEHPEYFSPSGGYGTLDNNEKFYWSGVSGNFLTGVLRGQLGTVATAHNQHDVVVPVAETGAIYAHPITNALYRVF